MKKLLTKEEALNAIKKDCSIYEKLPLKLQIDEEIAKLALENGTYFSSIPPSLSCQASFIKWAYSKKLLKLDYDQYLLLSLESINFIKHVPSNIKNSFEFQAELKKVYLEDFISSYDILNKCKTAEEVNEQLLSNKVKIINKARSIYKNGILTQKLATTYMMFFIHGNFENELMYEAGRCREYELPFKEIDKYFIYRKRELERKINIQTLLIKQKHGSFPERFTEAVLKQINIEFFREIVFPWSKDLMDDPLHGTLKRYDFYLPSLNSIIEVHGSQHYEGGFEHLGGRTKEQEQTNDLYKKNLALKNGIKHYIEIDASISDLTFLKYSFTNNKALSQLFDLTKVNWDDLSTNNATKELDVSLSLLEIQLGRVRNWLDAMNKAFIPDDSIALESSNQEAIKKIKLLRERKLLSNSGLSPEEELALFEADKYEEPLNRANVPGKWFFEYGIRDLNKIFKKLYDLGYIEFETHEKTLSRLNKIELIFILDAENITYSKSAKKSDLVNLILNNVDVTHIDQYIEKKRYQLTQKGEKELNQFDYRNYRVPDYFCHESKGFYDHLIQKLSN